MSAFGPKQTCASALHMSAFGGKADMPFCKGHEKHMSDFHEGGCLCRDIRYRAFGPPLEAIVCHCNFCQRRTGAAFAIEVFFPANQVEFIGSSLKTYEHRSEVHGRWLRLDFCSRCGTSIGVTAERRPGQRGLNGGTFDDPTWFAISRHIWTTSKVPWVEIPADVPSR